jgi:homoserine dehydrogenase
VAWAALVEGDRDGVAAVRPALVSRRSPLARVTGSQNVVTVVGELGGETAFVGQGAGGDATAVAVVSDLLAIAHTASAGAGASGFSRPRGRVSADYTAPHYIRFTVDDRPGILAAIAAAFARQAIGINAVLQHPGAPTSRLPFVMTLEPCDERRLDAALAEINTLDFHVQPPTVLPMFEAARGMV